MNCSKFVNKKSVMTKSVDENATVLLSYIVKYYGIFCVFTQTYGMVDIERLTIGDMDTEVICLVGMYLIHV